MRSRLRRLAIAAAALVALVVAGSFGTLRLMDARSFQLFGQLVQHVDTAQPEVALTFDDGPTAGPTHEVIDTLRRAGAAGTFFAIGQDLEADPQIGRDIVAAGDELANHSYSHDRMVFRPMSFYVDEVERTDRLIRAAGQRGEILFRPPFSKKLVGLPWYLDQHGRTTVMWDVEPDSESGGQPDAATIVADTLRRVRPGSIVLLHVMYGSRATSLGAVGPIVAGLQARGYRLVTVSELLRAGHASGSCGITGRDCTAHG